MRLVFATRSLPEVLALDNGSSFTSAEFVSFTKQNGINYYVTSTPYHLSSNDMAKQAVQTLKAATIKGPK